MYSVKPFSIAIRGVLNRCKKNAGARPCPPIQTLFRLFRHLSINNKVSTFRDAGYVNSEQLIALLCLYAASCLKHDVLI